MSALDPGSLNYFWVTDLSSSLQRFNRVIADCIANRSFLTRGASKKFGGKMV
jgi:hypothetical protein